MSIVKYESFLRWVREKEQGTKKKMSHVICCLLKSEVSSCDAKFPRVRDISPLVGGNRQIFLDISLVDPVHGTAASLQHLHLTAAEIDRGGQSILCRRREIDPDIIVGVLPLIIDKTSGPKCSAPLATTAPANRS
ncbi:hypothetical protein [uncultured Rubinisphaera sp.]|uniref:hypothetical protein n=1 Tax=uncultured Rubinisphaera sp. TaxID=1678686 RepID=UPI0030DD1145